VAKWRIRKDPISAFTRSSVARAPTKTALLEVPYKLLMVATFSLGGWQWPEPYIPVERSHVGTVVEEGAGLPKASERRR